MSQLMKTQFSVYLQGVSGTVEGQLGGINQEEDALWVAAFAENTSSGTVLPLVGPNGGFNGHSLGVRENNKEELVLNTKIAQPKDKGIFLMPSMGHNALETDLLVRARIKNFEIDGVTQDWMVLEFKKNSGGGSFDLINGPNNIKDSKTFLLYCAGELLGD